MKSIRFICAFGLALTATFTHPYEYMSYGNFMEPIKNNFTIQDCNGSISQGYGYGYYNKGLKFHRDGNIVEPTCQWQGRVELYAYNLSDVMPDSGAYRWYGFSFKVMDDSALDHEEMSRRYAIIQQLWSPTAIGGKKIEFFLSKRTGELTLNFAHSIRCDYENASEFINTEGESLCRDKTKVRKVYHEPHNIETGKWYFVRLGVRPDAPVHGKTVADGDIRAAAKKEGGSWRSFTYYGPNGKRNYFKTFTHELTPNGDSVQHNYFKFGWYGPAEPGKSGVIYFDEVYSNSYFGGLPSLYRD